MIKSTAKIIRIAFHLPEKITNKKLLVRIKIVQHITIFKTAFKRSNLKENLTRELAILMQRIFNNLH